MEKFYARYKLFWSKPILEEEIKYHLSTLTGDILCGIHKRIPGIYDTGISPLENIQQQEYHICKKCFKKYNQLTIK